MRRTLVFACLVAAVFPSLAQAHARLLRSVPANGVVVARAPTEVRLFYDDNVSTGPGNEVVRNGDGSALAGAPRAHGRQLVLPLRAGLADGDYSVRWSVISDDGHIVQGVLAFAIGSGQPAPQSSLRPVARSRTLDSIERWLFLLGVLAAGGAAIFRYAAFGPGARELAEPERGRALRTGSRVIAGLLVAGCALCVAGAVPLARAANGSATRFGLVLEVAAALALLGAVLAALALRLPGLLPTAALVAVALLPLPSLSGHALDPGQPFYAPVADVLHVLAASVWLGGLLALAAVLTLVRGRAPERAGRRFSNIALGAVLVVAATGLVRAVTELAAFHQLWSTTYGRVLLVKSALLLALVALGFANRRRLRLPVVLAELAVLAALVLAAAVLTGSRPGVRQPALAVRPVAAGPIALPPRDALALGAGNGRDAFTIAARFAAGKTEVTVAVLGPDGLSVNGLPVRVNGLSAIACGQGCYRALLPGRPVAARIDAGTGPVVFPLRTIPGPAASLVASAGRLLRTSTSTVFTDRLSSGPGQTLNTLWKEQAPDRLSYVIAGGSSGIVIGARRWDRDQGGRWVASPQFPLHLPTVPWTAKLTNFDVLAADRAGWTVAFVDRSTPAWFRVRIDRRTGRLVSFRMTAAAHFMRDEYLSYNKKVEIRPPR
jgi:copper transport protein